MRPITGVCLSGLALALAFFAACGGQQNNNENHGGGRMRLRDKISVDLSQVASLVALAGQTGGGAPSDFHSVVGVARNALQTGCDQGPQLLALTLSGETLSVALVESGDPQHPDNICQPRIEAIFPTASSILFSTMSLQVARPGAAADSTESVDCSTIVARRSDGALFCAPLALQIDSTGNPDQMPAYANAAGDVVYALGSTPGASSKTIYKISLGGASGPTATAAIDPSIQQINKFIANPAGDLYVNYNPSPLEQCISVSRVIPGDGSSAFTLQGQHNNVVTVGRPGDADENTFYVTDGGGCGTNFSGTLRIASKTGSTYSESTHVPNLANVLSYWFVLQLKDGIYLLSSNDKALVRVFANGQAVASPTPVLLAGVDHLVNANGMPMRLARELVVLFVSTGTGYEFLRHDGIVQQDIPLPANVEPSRVAVSADGAIELFGTRTDTQEKIRGAVGAGATEVVVTGTGSMDPAQIVVFTRIN